MNHPSPSLHPWLATLAFAATLSAQDSRGLVADAPPPARSEALPAAAAAWSWRVPIHTQPGNPGYGWWAADADYKASFHDGFVFYPRLGEAYAANLPLRWTTESVSVGGVTVAEPRSPMHSHTDSRYEYRYEGLTEAYEVRADGVEQTFVLQERPAMGGDLVVAGRFDTELRCAPLAAAVHADLTFTDGAGRPVVRYGKATAVDAMGKTLPMTTGFDGVRVRLTVPGDWLAQAAYPVTIDPLTAPVATVAGPIATRGLAIHREEESAANNIVMSYCNVFSATDRDVLARVCSNDLLTSSVIFAEVSGDWVEWSDVSYVGGADRWVVAYWVHSGPSDRIRAYFHTRGNTTVNSGLVATHLPGSTEHHSFPSVGGSAHPTTGTTALVVYRSDPIFGNSDTSVIWGVGADATNRAFLSQRVKVNRIATDGESPDVTSQLGWNDNGWIVAYQGRFSPIDDHDIYVARISTAIGWMGESQVGPDDLGDKARPVVEGWDGHYLVAMLQDVTPELNGLYFGRNVRTERFEWGNLSGVPNRLTQRVVSTSAQQDLTQLRLAFDGLTQSHWVLTHDADAFTSATSHVKRLGYSGGVVEALRLDAGASPRYHAAVTWNVATGEFPIVYCSTQFAVPIAGQRLQYPDAFNQPYGTGCGPATISSDVLPYAGRNQYRLSLIGAPGGQVGALLFGNNAAGIDLGVIGGPGCKINVTSLGSLSIGVGASGSYTFSSPLPDSPVVKGDIYWQFVYGWPTSPNPLKLGLTSGLRTHID